MTSKYFTGSVVYLFDKCLFSGNGAAPIVELPPSDKPTVEPKKSMIKGKDPSSVDNSNPVSFDDDDSG